MARNVLVGFDGSVWSHSAALMAGWLARQGGAKVSLLRAVVPEGVGSNSTLVGAFKSALIAVDSEAAELRRGGVQAEGMALVGEPVRLIMRAIAQQEPLLVAVGTFGRQPVDNWLLGSVADKLARSSPVPVLLMPETDWAAPRAGEPLRVLVPLDGSLSARGALTLIGALAPSTSIDATLLEMSDQPSQTPLVRQASSHGSDGGVRRMVMDIFEDVPAGADTPRLAIHAGQPARQIVEFAQDGRYDLIALMRSGWSGRQQMLLGQVAEAVVRQSPLPLLVVPLPALIRPSDEVQRELLPA